MPLDEHHAYVALHIATSFTLLTINAMFQMLNACHCTCYCYAQRHEGQLTTATAGDSIISRGVTVVK